MIGCAGLSQVSGWQQIRSAQAQSLQAASSSAPARGNLPSLAMKVDAATKTRNAAWRGGGVHLQLVLAGRGLQDVGFAIHLVNTASVNQYDGLKYNSRCNPHSVYVFGILHTGNRGK